MPTSYSERRGPRARPFVLSTLTITVIATCALLLRGLGHDNQHVSPLLRSRVAKPQCHQVRDAKDQCAFVRAYCADDEAGLLPYLSLYYCALGSARPVAFVVMVLWLGLLFTTIGIAASDFFSVNLSTIASILGLSESLAGVTFLALGNGSPDVFSTFAAMNSNSGSMAVGELIGAAGFITAVVAGSMALVREFQVNKKSFVRDICFFIAAVSFTILFLADNELQLWECCVMIGFYVFYVFVVVGLHWLSTRRSRMRMKVQASRGHYYGVTGPETDVLAPYHDEGDDDDTAPVGQRTPGPGTPDISTLERASLVDRDTSTPLPPDDDDEERGRHVTAEMTSSMRVNRPRHGRSNTTITPIRPSLVGALEFRSVLASLQKARNMHLSPLPGRSYSDQRTPGLLAQPIISPRVVVSDSTSTAQAGRDRALSSGNSPLNLHNAGLPQPDLLRQHPVDSAQSVGPVTTSVGGWLSPAFQPQAEEQLALRPSPPNPRPDLRLHVPVSSKNSSCQSSPSLSPFPALSDSPRSMTPISQDHPVASLLLPCPALGRPHSIVGLDQAYTHDYKPVKWWPYKFLPPPHVLLQTLFPTLQGWREKSFWDKMASIVSVPSIFILVTTLPVVETESDHEGSETSDAPALQTPVLPETRPVSPIPSVVVERAPSNEPETEWQHYRRSTRSISPRSSRCASRCASPAMLASEPERATGQQVPTAPAPVGLEIDQRTRKIPSLGSGQSLAPSEEVTGWNRWLVAVQIFTGPLFIVTIIWANTREESEQPAKLLLRLILSALLASMVMLAVLLTTSPIKRPKYHHLLCFLGFLISIAWISTVAGEVVGVLKAFGVILNISEAILGLTIFAVGNSLGDLVADVTVARLGYPVMALAACFGGPMLNILLGVGIGGAWMTIKAANKKHEKDPNTPVDYQPHYIEVGSTLMVSAATLLLTLVVLLIVVPLNRWVMSRRIGWGLIAIWTVGTAANLIVELTGA